MDARSNAAPVIIKRKKIVSGGGHHGGAWKVAYADFVTAMMAFFLLMWLLGATTEKQRKGIADYFSPTVPVNRVSGGGSGAFGGDTVFSEQSLAQSGTGASSLHSTESHQARGDLGVTNEGANAGARAAETSASPRSTSGSRAQRREPRLGRGAAPHRDAGHRRGAHHRDIRSRRRGALRAESKRADRHPAQDRRESSPRSPPRSSTTSPSPGIPARGP